MNIRRITSYEHYNIVNHKNVTVENVLASQPINISFIRTLDDNKW
jgi:hypothetical protein